MALTDSLISHWKMDEASGNALDSHGTNDLTETSGTIASATGKIGNCRDFEAGDSEYFERSDNASLSTGDIDFTFAAWVNGESFGSNAIISKDNGATWEYEIYQAGSRFRFYVESASSSGSAVANSLGAPSSGTWYFVVAWHDSVANTLNIQVNNGTVDSVSYSGGVRDSAHAFRIGAEGSGGTSWDGLIDSVSFWKRVLTSDERTALYNGGAGLDYPLSTFNVAWTVNANSVAA